MTITQLIDKQDNFEIVRDQLGAILALEVASQMTLAEAAAKNPLDWKMRIFSQRANPWEQLLNEQEDRSPIINIWFDGATFPQTAGSTVDHQKAEGVFNIDCYGYAMSSNEIGGGHNPGDEGAALEAHKALRLVRNILMAGTYAYLGLQGLVWSRWPQSVTAFQPEENDRPIQNIVGARLAFGVTYHEDAPQVEPVTLELLSADVKRTEDGEIVVEADYDYTV